AGRPSCRLAGAAGPRRIPAAPGPTPDTRRAPVVGGPSSGKAYLVAWRSRIRPTRSTRAPPPISAIPARSIGPELAPVKGSWPPAVALVAPPTAAAVVVVSSSEVDGLTLVSGAVVGGAVVGGAVVVVVSSSHLGRSTWTLSLVFSPVFAQWTTATTVRVPVVPGGRSNSPEIALLRSPSDTSPTGSPALRGWERAAVAG